MISPPPGSPRKRKLGQCTPAQRMRIRGRACTVCGQSPCDPAHLIPRSLCPAGSDDPRAVIPLCREHHRAYDSHDLDLLPYLEAHELRAELAFAVERFGLISSLERITNLSWLPQPSLGAA